MNNMKKYAFYISGNSGRLFKFIEQADTEVHNQIKIVISDKMIPEELRKLLLEKGIRYLTYEYSTLKGNNNREKNRSLSDLILKQLVEFGINYMFSFGGHILSGDLLKKYCWRLINFHPAILPMYPGRKAIDQAVEHGNTLLVGNTAHFMDEGVDTGKIIMQSVIPINAFMENGRDYDIVLDLQVEMLNRLIRIINNNNLKVDKNGNVIVIGGNYTEAAFFPKII